MSNFPTISFTINGNTTLVSYYTINPYTNQKPSTGNWYYYVIKNTGANDNIQIKMSSSNGVIPLLNFCLIGSGGNGGQTSSESGIGGGGGSGQVLQIYNYKYLISATSTSPASFTVYLYPIGNTDDTCQLILSPTNVYNACHGNNGANGNGYNGGNGGDGGTGGTTAGQVTIIGGAGGNGGTGVTNVGTNGEPGTSYAVTTPTSVIVTFQDGTQGNISQAAGGASGCAGSTSSIMIYFTA